VCGVRATNVVIIFMMAFVGIVILSRMIKDRSTIRQTFPITIQHHYHLRLIVIIVETLPKKECRVGNVFVMNIDTTIVCAMPRVLTRFTLTIRALIIILKTISILFIKTLTNNNSFQNTSNFEHCGGSSENFYEPNSYYDSYGFNQPPQIPNKFQVPIELIDEMKSVIETLKEWVANRYTHTSKPHAKSMEEILAEERKAKFCECCMYDNDDSMITIVLNPQKESITPSVEPEDSLKMGDEHLNTIPATESDEFNKSSVENLVPIPSESEEISNDVCEFVENNRLDNRVEIFSDSDNDDSISCGEIDYVDEEPPELVSLEEENDEEVDTEIQDEALRETLLNVNLLISRIEALNDPPTSSPIPDMDSDFLPELEIFRFEETSSGSPTIHADISLPDYERFVFEIDSIPISDNPSLNPLLEDIDLFLAADDSIPPGIENDENDILSSRPPAKSPDEDFESGTNEVVFGVVDEIFEQDAPVLNILPTHPTRDSQFNFALIIRVFQLFYTYTIISSFHSTGSEDTIFDPGISIFCAISSS
jgi:hypothetical protein